MIFKLEDISLFVSCDSFFLTVQACSNMSFIVRSTTKLGRRTISGSSFIKTKNVFLLLPARAVTLESSTTLRSGNGFRTSAPNADHIMIIFLVSHSLQLDFNRIGVSNSYPKRWIFTPCPRSCVDPPVVVLLHSWLSRRRHVHVSVPIFSRASHWRLRLILTFYLHQDACKSDGEMRALVQLGRFPHHDQG